MAFELDNMLNMNKKKTQSLYNPNDITKTASAGIGSGNPVQSAQQKQQNMFQQNNMSMDDDGFGYDPFGYDQPNAYDYNYGAQNVSDPFTTTQTQTNTNNFNPNASQSGMNQMDILRGYFPDIDDDTLSQYQQFITPIPGELYEATDPNFGLYTSLRKEKTGFLSDSRQRGREDLRSALFTGHREARGLEGRRGFVSGRTIVSDISEEAARKGDALNQSFQKGLWDINQDIVGRVSSARKYYQSLVGQQRRDMLSLAELSDYFKNEDEE